MSRFEYIDLQIYSVFVVFNTRYLYNWTIWFGSYNMRMVDPTKADDSISRSSARLVKRNSILGL